MILVSQEQLEECSELLGPTSTFYFLLEAGKKYALQGLTPAYLYHEANATIEVTTAERLRNKLN